MKRIYQVGVFFLILATASNHAFSADDPILMDSFESPPTPAFITSFDASPVELTEGGSTTLIWTTIAAVSCTPSGGTGDWNLEPIELNNGYALIEVATAGIHTFNLICQGEIGADVVAQASVIANVAPPPPATLPAVITSFSATPVNITEGESTTISWVTQDATACISWGDWDQPITDLPTGNAVIQIATAGTYTFTLICAGGAGTDPVLAQTDVTVMPVPLPAAIISFTASPSTINATESTTISWTTQNAISCTPSGGAGDWSQSTITLPNGSADITIPTAAAYAFTLTCEGAIGSPAVKQTIVTVNPPVASCDPAPLSGTTESWVSLWGAEFPGPVFNNEDRTIRRDRYLAIEFNTANIIDSGLLVTVGNTQSSATRLGSISECPGDFDVPADCEHSWGIGGGITWATDGTAGACALKPDTTYYFNLTFTDGFDPNSTTCTSLNCVTTIQYVNQN